MWDYYQLKHSSANVRGLDKRDKYTNNDLIMKNFFLKHKMNIVFCAAETVVIYMVCTFEIDNYNETLN